MKNDNPTNEAATGASGHSADPTSPSPDQLIALAEMLRTLLIRRDSVLSATLIGEPSWEILLALYRAQAGAYRLTVSNAVRASGSPATTARRGLDRLAKLGLVQRKKDALDGRTVFIELAETAKQALDAYLVEIWMALHSNNFSSN